MKILTTSDWHIGNMFHGIDRQAEHSHFLEWLKTTIVEQQPDALLVAGDVFDNGNPSAAAQSLYYSFLADVTHECPWLKIVVTAGNHDSAHRLEAPRALLMRQRVEVRGTVHRKWLTDDASEDGHWVIDYDDLMIPLTSRDNEQQVLILAVPYLRSDIMVDGSYSKGVGLFFSELLSMARNRYPTMPIVMMAHMYASGADIAKYGSERIVVGGLEQVELADWQVRPDYLTCGHIHKRQHIWGTQWARYTGSVLPMSFAERGYQHGVDMVEIDTSRNLKTTFLEYHPQHRLVTLPDDDNSLELSDLLKLIKEKLPDRKEGVLDSDSVYLELRLRSAQVKPEDRKKIDDSLAVKNAVLCRLQQVMPEMELTTLTTQERLESVDDVLDRDPMEALKESFVIRYHQPMNERQLRLLSAIVQKVKNNNEE